MTIASSSGLEPAPAACRGGVVTIGNFDGVHLGHLSLLAELRRQARAVGGPAVAVTFDPHPLQLLQPERFLPVLTTTADRAALLQAGGADEVLILRTSPELLRLTPDEFFAEVLVGRLAARALVEGQDFCFGRNRAGSVETLTVLCRAKGLVLSVVRPLARDGVVVSSSRVRNALMAGDVRKATALLGRPYRLHGTVGAGQRRGRRLGFPTANLERFETVVPGDGVYAVRAWSQGASWPAAANVGPNPTFGEDARKVEVHLIGFSGDLYGAALAVDFVDRLRDTRPFGGIDDLVRQLRADVDQAARLAGPAS
jgi:riboflavin kinase / FMN adenylyltransferase